MKNIAITLLLCCVLACTAQAQRVSFEPEFGIQRQHSNQYSEFYPAFNNLTAPFNSFYKNFWTTDWNVAGNFDIKLYKNWSVVTGIQYLNLQHYYHKLPNQPWPTVWGDKILASTQHKSILKLGVRYNLKFVPDGKIGVFIEAGSRFIIRDKWNIHIPTDTFASVPNGYDATKVVFIEPRRNQRTVGMGGENQIGRYAYLSLRPYYTYKNIKFFGAIDYNVIDDLIFITNKNGQTFSSMITHFNNSNSNDFSRFSWGYAISRYSWNFSLGVQIPLIKDKKPKLKPEMNNEQYGF